jgi:leader peptidase (prepilin peptidase)/N-methyltransferase
LLFHLSYIDIKKREVPNSAVLTLFLFSLLVVRDYSEHFFMSLSCFAVLVAVSIITRGGIGGGDIKLITVLSFFMGSKFYEMIFFISFVMMVGFVRIFFKDKSLRIEVPLVPYIFLGYVLWIAVKYIFP